MFWITIIDLVAVVPVAFKLCDDRQEKNLVNYKISKQTSQCPGKKIWEIRCFNEIILISKFYRYRNINMT